MVISELSIKDINAVLLSLQSKITALEEEVKKLKEEVEK